MHFNIDLKTIMIICRRHLSKTKLDLQHIYIQYNTIIVVYKYYDF